MEITSPNTRGSELSISALSIFVAVSIAAIGFVATRSPETFGYNATTIAIGSLLFAVSVFLVSLEFFLLAVRHTEHYGYFGFLGSTLYGFGVWSMIIGICLTLVGLDLRVLGYLLLAWVSFLYFCYYLTRVHRFWGEEKSKLNWYVRGSFLVEIGAGFYLMGSV